MVAITWLGHATALIELDGTRLLTDPVLRAHVGPLVRIAPKVDRERLGPIDCVLLSHLHADHTDLGSLRAVAREIPVIAPAAAAGWLARRGVHGACELRAGEATTIKGVRVTAVPAAHDARRSPFGPVAEPLGYLLGGSNSTYFAGDTDLFEAMGDLRGRTDVALLPVAGWGPRLPAGHLNPERAARAAALIAPQLAIPIHWGTLSPMWSRRPTDPTLPAREFAALARRLAPGVAVRVLAPGERVQW
jgi:L-ascorbate metabolism protein UlaG (beta-lactamase superfamily)